MSTFSFKKYQTNRNYLIAGIVLVLCIVSVYFVQSRNQKKQFQAKTTTVIVTEQKGTTPTVKKSISVSPTNSITRIPFTPTPTQIIQQAIQPTNTPVVNTPPPYNPTATPVPPTATPQPQADTQPPKTTIIYPTQNGEITYKTDGKVCATASAPTDNVSNHSDIETAFRFDGDGWSGFEKNRSYFCKDSLSNGAHALSVQSRDKAGNTESEQIINFTVNIAGN